MNALGVPGDEAAADGSVRFLYAGDTQGNLWKFDFTGNAPWLSREVLSFGKTPLMVAMEAGGADARRQPITVQPVVGAGPNGGAIVLFGTGKFVSPDDLSHANYGVQTLYAVHDNGVAIPAGAARTQLQPRAEGVAGGGVLPSITGDAFVYGAFDRKTTRRRGWYFDLPGSPGAGERLVSDPVLADGQLFFNTLMPRPSACGDNGGGGHSCAVNAMTGLSNGGTCVLAEAGLPGTTHLMQLGDTSYGAADAFGRRTATRRLSVVHLGGRGGVSTSRPVEGGQVSQMAGRLNWRQVIDYRGRFRAGLALRQQRILSPGHQRRLWRGVPHVEGGDRPKGIDRRFGFGAGQGVRPGPAWRLWRRGLRQRWQAGRRKRGRRVASGSARPARCVVRRLRCPATAA